MQWNYRVKRLLKADEYNRNGYIIDSESLNKCLDELLEYGVLHILEPFVSDEEKILKNLVIVPLEKTIGSVCGYDDEYFYLNDIINPRYEDCLDEYSCEIALLVNPKDDYTNEDGILVRKAHKVLQLRLIKNIGGK